MDETENEDSLLSPHTNRPVTEFQDHPIFWCELCRLKMKTVYIAIQHLTGKTHIAKVNKKDESTLKRKPISTLQNSNSSDTKRSKTEVSTSSSSSASLSCDDCGITLPNELAAIQHFTSRRHAKTITKMKEKWLYRDSTNHRGHAGRGHSRRGTAGGHSVYYNMPNTHVPAGRGMFIVGQNRSNQVDGRKVNSNILVRRTVLPDEVREHVDLSKVKHFVKGQQRQQQQRPPYCVLPANSRFANITTLQGSVPTVHLRPGFQPNFPSVHLQPGFQGNFSSSNVQSGFQGNVSPARYLRYY